MTRWVARGLAAALMAALAPLAAAQADLPVAAFSAEQAGQGAAVYVERCAACHGEGLTGSAEAHAPPLMGAGFWSGYAGAPASRLYSRIIGTMPLGDPGSLDEADTLALTADIARANGAAEGAAIQSASQLETMRMNDAFAR